MTLRTPASKGFCTIYGIVQPGMKRERWVIKAGSNLICSGGPLLLRAWMQQVEALKRSHGLEVVWVTSGAIASAVDKLSGKPTAASRKLLRKKDLADKQALSAIGQPLIMDLYNLALQACSLTGAQILLTYDDMANPKRRKNFQNTLEKLLGLGAVPILNENDAVATEEIRFGDNDSLSAKVARTLKADRLVILTDVKGFYDGDPSKNKSARLITEVERVTPRLLSLAGAKSGSGRGTGGMLSKLMAAREASRSKIDTYLVKGDLPGVLTRLAEGESLGTRIRG